MPELPLILCLLDTQEHRTLNIFPMVPQNGSCHLCKIPRMGEARFCVPVKAKVYVKIHAAK